MVRPAFEGSLKDPQKMLSKKAKVNIEKDEPITPEKICQEI